MGEHTHATSLDSGTTRQQQRLPTFGLMLSQRKVLQSTPRRAEHQWHSSNLLAVLHSLLKTGRAGIVLQLELSCRNNGTPELPTATPAVRQQVRLQSTPRRTRCRGQCQCDEMTEIVLNSLLHHKKMHALAAMTAQQGNDTHIELETQIGKAVLHNLQLTTKSAGWIDLDTALKGPSHVAKHLIKSSQDARSKPGKPYKVNAEQLECTALFVEWLEKAFDRRPDPSKPWLHPAEVPMTILTDGGGGCGKNVIGSGGYSATAGGILSPRRCPQKSAQQ
jgi:hypothetical protein